MALFLIEREYAEAAGLPDESGVQGVVDYNGDHELRWLFSFLSADQRKSYCLYEAPDAEALRQHAKDLGVPADVIVEVGEVNPALILEGATSASGHPVDD